MKITMIHGLRAFALGLVLASTACSSSSTETKASAEPKSSAKLATSAGHAAANVKPGSHDDWCEEHQVPESKCTRCNPKLIPAFKATKDWCEEHAMPESQCTKCNPDVKIVRPPEGS